MQPRRVPPSTRMARRLALLAMGAAIASVPSGSRASDGEGECTADDPPPSAGQDFFCAWPEDEGERAGGVDRPSLIEALFPDLAALRSAWEVRPLLSRVSFDAARRRRAQTEAGVESPPTSRIPTIFHDRTLVSRLEARGSAGDPFLSIMAVDDTAALLAQRPRADYKLVKKIVMPSGHPEAGEEYNGIDPKSTQYSLQEVLAKFHHGGFSLIVNNVQKRWRPASEVALALEDELSVPQVGVNMYLTPEVPTDEAAAMSGNGGGGGVRQGFEAHWDWMDVVVVQLSGRKRWSVASEPSVYLSNIDQKRKPTRRDLEGLGRYDDFTLCPGDALYIPRGHVHNASTVSFDGLSDGDGGTAGAEDLDGCPSYPPEMALSGELSSRLAGPSLHLTFGLLQSGATVEKLLHHAMDSYLSSEGGGGVGEKVAIRTGPWTSCPVRVKWKSILHHSLAEVARRKHECDTILSNAGDGAKRKGEKCDGTVVLRRAVPLLLHSDRKETRQYTNLKEVYLVAIDAFASSASLDDTADFVKSHLLGKPADESLAFRYPGFSEDDAIPCPDELMALSDGGRFSRLIDSFRDHARGDFDGAMERMRTWGRNEREKNRRKQESELTMVGQ